MCPVTMLEMNGNEKFYLLKPSGRVVSARALQEVPSTLNGEAMVELFPDDAALEERRKALPSRKKRKRVNGNP